MDIKSTIKVIFDRIDAVVDKLFACAERIDSAGASIHAAAKEYNAYRS